MTRSTLSGSMYIDMHFVTTKTLEEFNTNIEMKRIEGG